MKVFNSSYFYQLGVLLGYFFIVIYYLMFEVSCDYLKYVPIITPLTDVLKLILLFYVFWGVVQGTEVVATNSRSHTCLLSGVSLGNVKVLVRLQFGIEGSRDVAMKLSVRSEDEAIGDAIHEIVSCS
jgi:hypothetical protein